MGEKVNYLNPIWEPQISPLLLRKFSAPPCPIFLFASTNLFNAPCPDHFRMLNCLPASVAHAVSCRHEHGLPVMSLVFCFPGAVFGERNRSVKHGDCRCLVSPTYVRDSSRFLLFFFPQKSVSLESRVKCYQKVCQRYLKMSLPRQVFECQTS